MVPRDVWFATTLVGGSAVLLSYAAGVQSPRRSMLLVGWGGATLRAWILCAALTALAFLYIQGEL